MAQRQAARGSVLGARDRAPAERLSGDPNDLGHPSGAASLGGRRFAAVHIAETARRTAGRLILWAASGILLAAALASPAAGQTGSYIDREYAVKAAFLYNFLSYIEWPEEAFQNGSDPFVIGVYEDDPFGRLLDSLTAKTPVGSRRIVVRRLNSTDSLSSCHIIFIPDSLPPGTQNAVIRAVHGTHVLTVGESDDFAQRGGSVQFLLEGNKVRFAFNTQVIDQKKLRVSSKLLSLAKTVPNQ